MSKIFSIIMMVAIFANIKAIVIIGLNASINEYIGLLGDLGLIEVLLWLAIATSTFMTLQNRKWVKSTYISKETTVDTKRSRPKI